MSLFKTIAVMLFVVVLMYNLQEVSTRPAGEDTIYIISGEEVRLSQLSDYVQGECKLYKATTKINDEDVQADFCAGTCFADSKSCSSRQPTKNGITKKKLEIKNQDGTTSTIDWEVISECSCVNGCQLKGQNKYFEEKKRKKNDWLTR